MAVSQKQGVFDAVEAFCAENGIQFDAGQKFDPSKEQRAAIVEMVAQAMDAGEIEIKADARTKYDTFDKLRSYCNGLVSNWLRKDTRLNGGEKHEIKNPGSRAGAGDDQVRELRKLKSTLSDPEQIEAVEAAINERLSQLKKEKTKAVSINIDVLPEEIRHLVSA